MVAALRSQDNQNEGNIGRQEMASREKEWSEREVSGSTNMCADAGRGAARKGSTQRKTWRDCGLETKEQFAVEFGRNGCHDPRTRISISKY